MRRVTGTLGLEKNGMVGQKSMIDDRKSVAGQKSVMTESASTKGRSRKSMVQLNEDASFSVIDLDEDMIPPKKECGASFVFAQDSTVVVAWSLLLFVLLIYVGTVFLYRFTFLSFHFDQDGIQPLAQNNQFWSTWDSVVDVLFWIDLIFNFFLSYTNIEGEEVKDLWRIARRYLRCFFWINLLACLPEYAVHVILELIFDGVGHAEGSFEMTRLLRLQHILRLARLSRLTVLIKLVSLRCNIPVFEWFRSLRFVRVFNFLFWLTFTCHLMACGWYLIAAFNSNPHVTWVAQVQVDKDGLLNTSVPLLERGPFEQWMFSMYFIITVFTTVGFGDISPNTEPEILYCFFVMLVGAVVHSIIISEVIQVITSTDQIYKVLENHLELLGAFSSHTNLDPQLSERIQAEFRERHKRGMENGFNKAEMKGLLLSKYMPRSIVNKLPAGLYRGKLCKNLFLAQCGILPPRLPSMLAIQLLPADFIPGEVVYQFHDFAFNLGLVIGGICAYVGQPGPRGGKDAIPATVEDTLEEIEDSKHASVTSWLHHGTSVREEDSTASRLSPYRLIGDGNYFGDLECFTGSMRVATIRCERTSTVLLLKKSDLFETISEFPQYGEVWASDAWRRESLRKKALERLRRHQNCRSLAAITVQRVFHERWYRKDRIERKDRKDTGNHVDRTVSHESTILTSSHLKQRDLKQMAVPAQSQVCLAREVDKIQRGVLGMQSQMNQVLSEVSVMRSEIRGVKLALGDTQALIASGKMSL